MANRNYTEYRRSHEKYPVDIFVNLLGTGAAAPTLQKWTGTALAAAPTGGYRGAKSITRSGTGDYILTLQDNFNRLLALSCFVVAVDGSTTPVASKCWGKVVTPAASGGTTIRLVFYLATPATPADLTSNDEVYLQITLSNSSVP
jgi:hypothetical protein